MREFAGSGGDDIRISVNSGTTEELNVVVGLEGREAHDVEVRDEAYGAPVRRLRVAPGGPSTLTIDVSRTHGWYDFTVHVAGLVYRYAGRIETGKWSITDPAMGEKA